MENSLRSIANTKLAISFNLKGFVILFTLFLFSSIGISQTTYSWRNDQNPTSGQWNVANYWWNGSGAVLPSGGEILFLDGSIGLTMTNDLPATNRYRILFGSGGSSRIINGTSENTFYDYSMNKPKIENNSSNNQTVSFPIKLGYNPLELNPVNGDLTITSAINNNGNFIDVYGPNSKVLSITGDISGSGGISLKQNSKIVFSTVSKSYTGATVIEAGNIELSVSLASSLITVKSGATLTITGTGTSVTINALTIESGGIVKVQSGNALTVNGTLTNNAASGIVLESPLNSGAPGSLITNGTVGGTGTLKAERYITAYTGDADGWHLLSSPVNTAIIASNTNLSPGVNDDLFAWNETAYEWTNYKPGNVFTSMVNGNGYLVAYQTAATKYMIGAPNNSDMTFTNLTKTTGKGEGWHLLGNPFTSAIKWNPTTDNQYAISQIGGVAKLMGNSGGYTDISANSIIPAMQGFFVQAASAANTITIPLNARTHSTTNWTKSADNSHILLTANDLESQMVQESWVRVNDLATSGYDYQHDSHFMPLYAPQFYSLAGEEKLSTNCLPSIPAESLIPFGFVKNDASSFSIELKESIDGYQVFLKDLKTNTDQNLTENPVYTFTSEANDDPNRFLLHFLSTVGTADPVLPATSRIYVSNRNIYIEGLYAKSEILVRNMLGQVVASRNANGTGEQVINTANLTAGVYVVSVVTGKQVISEKVVIK